MESQAVSEKPRRRWEWLLFTLALLMSLLCVCSSTQLALWLQPTQVDAGMLALADANYASDERDIYFAPVNPRLIEELATDVAGLQVTPIINAGNTPVAISQLPTVQPSATGLPTQTRAAATQTAVSTLPPPPTIPAITPLAPTTTPPASPTPVPTATKRPTSTPISTPTAQPTASSEPTIAASVTSTFTVVPPSTATFTPSATPFATATHTAIPPVTPSETAVLPSDTPTHTPTPVYTATPSATPSHTPTPGSTPTPTYSPTPSPTATDTPTPTPTSTPPSGDVLMVVGTIPMNSTDTEVFNRLTNLGYIVATVEDDVATASDADGKALVYISSTAFSTVLGSTFRDVPVPMVVAESLVFDEMGMTAPGDNGTIESQLDISIVDAGHPLAAGFSGQVTVLTFANQMRWGLPNGNAAVVATVVGDAGKCTIFAYEAGAGMVGLNAPARRVGFFLSALTGAALNGTGWQLFDAAVLWAVGG